MIIGLGNPGDQYISNRHNIGFIVLDELVGRWRAAIPKDKWQSQYSIAQVGSCKVHLVKPMAYMNKSGHAVARFCQFFKIAPDNLLIIHDDLDMAPARIKLVRGGGAGGHNGVKSIIQILGYNDFYRLKIGIGRPGQGGVHPDFPVDKYVLSDFGTEEMNNMHNRFADLVQGIEDLIVEGPSVAMNLLNRLK